MLSFLKDNIILIYKDNKNNIFPTSMSEPSVTHNNEVTAVYNGVIADI